MKELIIDEQTAGGRLDKAVLKYLNKATSGFVYKMLRKKNIVLNGVRAKGNELLQPGDVIRLYLADDTILKFRAEHVPAAGTQDLIPYIVYEDEHIIALNKPAGMLSQKSVPGDSSLNDLLVEYLGSDELFTPGISNRLDRNTSGLILAAKNPGAVRQLNDAIRLRQLTKLYLAAVSGIPDPEGVLEGYLAKDHEENKVRMYAEPPADPDGCAFSKCTYQVLDSSAQASLLLVDLLTGRSHQIRAQFLAAGYPLLGDPKYGSPELNRIMRERYGLRAQLLHAYKVRFDRMDGNLSYLNGKSIVCPLPDQFNQVLKGENLCLHGVPEDSEVLNSKP